MNFKHTLFICLAIILVGALAYAGTTHFTALEAEDITATDDMSCNDDMTIGGDLTVTGAFSTAAISLGDDEPLNFGAVPDVICKYDEAGTDRLLCTFAAASGLNVATGNMFVGNGVPLHTPDGEDFYVEGSSELTGHVYTKANVYLVDDAILAFGQSNDAYFWYDEATDDLFKLTVASAAGGLQLQVGNLFIGNGSPGQTIDGEDLYVEGLAEIDGILYADGGISTAADISAGEATLTAIVLGDDEEIAMGADDDWSIKMDPDAGDSLVIEAALATQYAVITKGNFGISESAISPDHVGNGQDLYVADAIEIDGTAYFDGDVSFGGGQSVNVAKIVAGTHTLAATDYILSCDYTATDTVTITIPSAQIALSGRIIVVKDSGGNAASKNITISTEASETIDGAGNLVLSADDDSVNLYSDGTNLFVW